MFVQRGIDMKYSKNQILVFALIAIILILSMTLSAAYSAAVAQEYLRASQVVAPPAGDNTAPATTEPKVEPSPTEPTTAVGVVNGQPDDVDTTRPPTTTTIPANTTTTKRDNSEQIKSEVVKLYTTANKNAKNKAKSATLTYRNATNYKDVMEAGAFSDIAQFLMKTLMKEEKNLKEVHTDVAKAVPPANAACNLKASDVVKATREDKGSYYLVTILMKPDTNPKAGYGTGSVCSLITEKQIVDATKDFIAVSDINSEYDGAYLEAKIDKKTGNLTELYTRMPLYLSVSIKPRGQIFDFVNPFTGKVGLQFEERWTIAY